MSRHWVAITIAVFVALLALERGRIAIQTRRAKTQATRLPCPCPAPNCSVPCTTCCGKNGFADCFSNDPAARVCPSERP